MSISLREGGVASSLLHQVLNRHNGGSQPVTEFATSISVGSGPTRQAWRLAVCSLYASLYGGAILRGLLGVPSRCAGVVMVPEGLAAVPLCCAG